MAALTLNQADLAFILYQIKVAEINASGVPLTEIRINTVDGTLIADRSQYDAETGVYLGAPNTPRAIPDPHVPVGLRTVDGSNNNIVPGRETWGAADQTMPRLLDPSYTTGTGTFDTNGPAPGGVLNGGDYASSGSIVDTAPRTISNLIVDMSLNNPAAIIAALTYAGSEDVITDQGEISTAFLALKAARDADPDGDHTLLEEALDAVLAEKGVTVANGSIDIPNVAPDEGLSAPYNAWMTFFGQFFDHGLDLITKGGNGTIFVPLAADDPLVTHGPDGIAGTGDEVPAQTQFMVLTRATVVDGTQVNTTTPFVDQNQTYTSHASHQVFLREYAMTADGPVSTGRLLGGSAGGLATWADVKAQAVTMLGIQLSDVDVLNVPLLRTDAYGNFVPDPVTGFAQVITGIGADGIPNTADDITASGTSGNPVVLSSLNGGAGPVRTAHAFLDDIAHNAVPVVIGGALVPDTDSDTGNAVAMNPMTGQKLEYDNELLDRHFITGDGRGNENIGLTAVHHIFHSEHNRQVESQQMTILKSGDLAFINEWLVDPLTQAEVDALPSTFPVDATERSAFLNSFEWDGERLFQAARFATEMQYQHLVFEEFARKIQPAIDVFVFNSITDIDPSIFAEFANTVYRFGHSMLTENMPRIGPDGQPIDPDGLGLVESFLNPVMFDNDGGMSHDEGAAAIVRGMTIERGNEIDEFIVDALRNNLLGLPLDLASINIARGRDTGMPSLNDARAQLYAASSSTFLKPYNSWAEFAANIKNPASIINFIAAYGQHSTILLAEGLEAKRAAAMELVFGIDQNGDLSVPADRMAFLNSTGAWTAENSGLNSIDLWIGGLAEKKMPFGGFLGSTFNAVFELQLENLQDGDRFYYLTRTQGQNFLNALEQNSFAKMIMANTALADPGADGVRGTADDVITRHIGVDAFATYDYVLEVNAANQADYDPDNQSASGIDPTGNDPFLEAIGLGKVIRDDPNTPGADANYIRVFGGEHVVVGGTAGNDTIITDFGDDGIWGGAGDDRIESGAGVDLVNGGAGDDIITDSGDSGDFIKGDEGDDVIANSNGLDILMGGTGKDVVFVGVDATEVFAGDGDDFILGGADADFLLGNEGDDWMEAGEGFDTTAGDNSELFFNSAIKGHDVMFAGADEHDFDAESGDDIMVQGESVMRNEGMFGFDWAIFKGMQLDGYADMRIPIFTTEQEDILRNRFDKVEALSGWSRNDTLIGDDRVFGEIAPGATVATTENVFFNDGLDQEGIDRIAGLQAIVSVGATGFFESGNILLGGAGSDNLRGNGGDDILDGDRWLNVRIRITGAGQDNTPANQIATVDSLKHVFTAEDAGDPSWVGKSLFELMLSRTIVPNQLHIVREIVTTGASADDVDIAFFNDVIANYTVIRNSDGSVTVTHNVISDVIDPLTERNLVSDGTDTVRNVEILRFADGEIDLRNRPPVAGSDVVYVSDSTNIVVPWSVLLANDTDPDGDVLTIQSVTALTGLGANINVTVNALNQTVTFTTPNLGADDTTNNSFTYTISDGKGGTSTGTVVVRALNANNGGNDNESIANQAYDFSYLAGGAGNDTFNGGAGMDHFFGDAGNDTLNGGAGNDVLMGGANNDTLNGGSGNDHMEGGTGDDTYVVDSVDDLVIEAGGAGNDTVETSLGNYALGADIENLEKIGAGAITGVGNGLANRLLGNNGADTLDGGNGDDTIDGDDGNDRLRGGAGNDTFNDNSGNDVYVYDTAGFGNDVVNSFDANAGGGQDLIDLRGLGVTSADFAARVQITRISVPGTDDTLVTIRNAANTATIGTIRIDAVDPNNISIADFILSGAAAPTAINGTGGGNTLTGGPLADAINGQGGNDTINAGAGDDTIIVDVNEGRDLINGESEDVAGDTVVINGDGTDEVFRVYTREAWGAVAGNNLNSLNGATEIVITRNGTNNAAVIAELIDIEEIQINTGAGADQVIAIGDFSPTQLNFNTITINGDEGDDTVDISGLLSAHRILFRSNGGNDTIVGAIRPQDVIELADGQDISTYLLVDNGNGTKTLSNGTHSITFSGAVPPQFQETPPSNENENGISGNFEYTPSDLAGLKALVNGQAPDDGDDPVPTGVRTLSGYGNNLADPGAGAVDTPFIRITNSHYGDPDGAGNLAINPIFVGLDPRNISNILGAQEADLPKAEDANTFFMAFGQYFDHGLDFLGKGGNGVIQIGAPGNGAPGSGNPADLTRGTVYGYEDGVPQHINKTSPFVDQNQAYGSSDLVGQFLREGDGAGGLGAHLLQGGADPSNPAFKLMPTLREMILHHWENNTVFHSASLPGGQMTFRDYYPGLVIDGVIDATMLPAMTSNFMNSSHALLLDTNPYISLLDHYVAGDGRANENIALTSMHTIWARNHNFHVEGLTAAGFQGTAEEIFQAAKMINEAEYQRVVFTEFADKLIGGIRGEGDHGFGGYNPDATAAISHEFAAAVYRVGHSLVGQTMTVLDANGNPTQVQLFDAFLNPTNDTTAFTAPLSTLAQYGYVPQPGYEQLGVNAILGGIAQQPAEAVDFNIVDAVRNDLVRINADLFAFNVARGWDVGLGTLNQVRMDLAASLDPYVLEAAGYAGDLSAYTSWEDFQARNGLSDTVIAQFRQAYPDLVLEADEIAGFSQINPDISVAMQSDGTGVVKGIDRVDLWVGGLAEKHINGGMVGQTFWIVLHEQFDRLQEADRFYYTERFDGFDFYENFIDGQEFADIIARNTGMTDFQEDIFSPRIDDNGQEDDDDVNDNDDIDNDDDDANGGQDDDDNDNDDDGDTDGDSGDEDDDDHAGGDDCDTGTGNGAGPLPVAAAALIGTAAGEVLAGGQGNDTILAGGGGDILIGDSGSDILRGEDGDDVITAAGGDDVVSGGAGDDEVHGGSGNDFVFGNAGSDLLFGDDGDDVIEGGAGDDQVWGGAGNDTVLATAGDGNDRYWGDAGNDTLDYSVATGNLMVDLGNGFMGHGSISGGTTGSDTFYGFENFIGGSGHDVITASSVANVIDGGLGDDTFRFVSAGAADGDIIRGFQPGDKIDFSAVDANTTIAGKQSFVLNTGTSLTAIGGVAITHEMRDGEEFTIIRGHTDGDNATDFELAISGHHTLTSSDFNGVA